MQTLKTCTSCEEELVSDVSEMTLFRAPVKPCPFIIGSVATAVVLTRSLCRNGTLEVNPKVSLVMIKEVRRIFHLYNKCNITQNHPPPHVVSSKSIGSPAAPFDTAAIIDTCRQLVSPSASHSF